MNFQYPLNKVFGILALLLLLSCASQSQPGAATRITSSSAPSGANYIITNERIKIAGRSEHKVVLTWTPFDGAVSHYVLERSADGTNYIEAGVLFTPEGGEETNCFFTDKFRKPVIGTLYYRLRAVGMDGTEVYTMPSTAVALRPKK
jgi:hypothetical protein